MPTLFPIETFSRTNEPNEISRSRRKGRNIGNATATISSGCDNKNRFLLSLFINPQVKSPAKANQEIHWIMLRIDKVLALGDASNAGQEKETRKARAKNVKVLPQSFDKRLTLLFRIQLLYSCL